MNGNRFVAPLIDGGGSEAPSDLDIDNVRRVFKLLRELQQQGGLPFDWRLHAAKHLCEITNSQHAWISHEKNTAACSRILILSVAGVSADARIYRCDGSHQHPQIKRFLRRRTPGPNTIPDCAVFEFLGNIQSQQKLISSSICLVDQREVTTVAVCRSLDKPSFQTNERQVLRLFIVELARMVRRKDAGTFLDPLQIFPPRLREVIRLIADGKTEAQAARLMGIARNTVHSYLTNVYRKLNVSSRGEFLAMMGTIPRLILPKIVLDWPVEPFAQNQE